MRVPTRTNPLKLMHPPAEARSLFLRRSSRHWHHLIITRDGQHVQVYLDGKADPDVYARIKHTDPIQKLLIGNDGKAGPTFDGKVDGVAVFDRALPARPSSPGR
ncbi:LamG domain-containing protein [Pirellulales bacterium]|nr:LamG domain-containing protein [Pirellulales bacterium]